MIELWERAKAGPSIHAVIGPACSDACEPTAFLTAALKIPQVALVRADVRADSRAEMRVDACV